MSSIDREGTPQGGVLSTAEIKCLAEAVTPPCGVLPTTEMSGLDREGTPQGLAR